jgi:hypothetical protein
MGFRRSKPTALVVALSYAITAAMLARNVSAGVWTGAIAMLPVSLIWFPNFWSQAGGRITNETPASVVELAGWVVLVGAPIVLLLLYLLLVTFG